MTNFYRNFMLSTLLLTCLNSFGQNYNCVIPDVDVFYIDKGIAGIGDLICATHLQIDSMVPDGMWLTNFPELHDENYNPDALGFSSLCLTARASWIGPLIFLGSSGIDSFYNRDNEPIAIKKDAALNESWTAYSGSYGTITGICTSMDTMSFLGVQDSVKTLNLSGSGVQFELILSKNYGLIKTLNFRDFPYFTGNTFTPTEREFAGLSDPKLGFQRIKKGDIYSYEIGDEIHSIFHHIDNSGGYSYNRYYIKKILSKIFGTESVEYKIDVVEWGSSFFGNIDTSYIETLEILNMDSTYMQKLPGEFDSVQIMEGYYSYRANLLDGLPGLHFRRSALVATSDSCFQRIQLGGTINTSAYIGAGSYDDELYWTFSPHPNWNIEELVYCMKGDMEYGVELDKPDVVGLEEIDLRIRVYPNPAHNIIHVNYAKSNFQFQIIDVLGKQVSNHSSIGMRHCIFNVSMLKDGIYFYKLIDLSGEMFTGSFIKQ